MADAEDIQPLVVDNGTGMVKVRTCFFQLMSASCAIEVDSSLCACLNMILIYIFSPMFAGWFCR